MLQATAGLLMLSVISSSSTTVVHTLWCLRYGWCMKGLFVCFVVQDLVQDCTVVA